MVCVRVRLGYTMAICLVLQHQVSLDYIDLAFVGARFGRGVLVLISLENFQLVGTQHLPGVALKLCVPDFIWQLRRKAW